MSERDEIDRELDQRALWDALKVALYIAQTTKRPDIADKLLRILTKVMTDI